MLTLGRLKTMFVQSLANQGISGFVGDWAYLTLIKLFGTSHKFSWNKRRDDFDTVDGTAEYYLSPDVWNQDVLWMGDESVQGKTIVKKPLDWIYRYDSTPTEEGEPIVWAPVDHRHVQASNTATTSTAVSTSNADLSVVVTIRGKVSGVHRVETISLNGTTTATPSSALTWDADSIYSVVLDSACVGVVTVNVGNDIAVIPPGELRVECLRIRLHYVPGEVLTIPYQFYKRPKKPISDGDIIEVDDSAIPAVLKGIECYGHLHNGDVDFAEAAENRFNEMVVKLIILDKARPQEFHNKEWPQSSGGVPFYLPRTINATVVE